MWSPHQAFVCLLKNASDALLRANPVLFSSVKVPKTLRKRSEPFTSTNLIRFKAILTFVCLYRVCSLQFPKKSAFSFSTSLFPGHWPLKQVLPYIFFLHACCNAQPIIKLPFLLWTNVIFPNDYLSSLSRAHWITLHFLLRTSDKLAWSFQ